MLLGGIVVSNMDELREGRVQVRIPQLHGDETSLEMIPDIELPWAAPCMPFAGQGVGMLMVPEVGAGVWVLFLQEDNTLPIYLGSWFAAQDVILEHSEGYSPDPKNYVIKTPQGHLILLSDIDTDPRVYIRNSSEQVLLMDQTQILLNEITGQKLTLDDTKAELIDKTDQVLRLTPDSQLMELNAGRREAIVKTTDDLTVLAERSVTIGGALQHEVGGAAGYKVGGAASYEVGGALTMTSSGLTTITSSLLMTLTALAALSITALGAVLITGGAAVTITAVGAIQIFSTVLVLGVLATAQKLCNKAFMDLFNTHTHSYVPGTSGSASTSAPTVLAVEDTHTTQNVKGS